MNRLALVLTVSAAALLSACDMLGIESPERIAAARDAEGRAIGGACRHAGRAIEDCYTLNRKGDKAAIFAGWRDMNDYMRENKIDVVAPQSTTQLASARSADADDKPEKAAKAKAGKEDKKSAKQEPAGS